MRMNILFLAENDQIAVDRCLLIGASSEVACVGARVCVDCGWGERVRIDIAAADECICFKAVRTAGTKAFIGYGERLFIVNMSTDEVITYQMDGYFCDLFDTDDLDTTADDFCILASSASELLAFDLEGALLWKAQELGIDGVRANGATATQIQGSGEWDPPGGWEPFIVDRRNGERITVGTGWQR
jgi:hypothetical protein